MKVIQICMSVLLKRGIMILVAVALSVGCFSQIREGVIKGHVFDEQTHRPLFGVIVSKPGTSKKDTTLPDGSFLLPVDKGTHDLQFELKGFSGKIIQSVGIGNGELVYLDVYLMPATDIIKGNVDTQKISKAMMISGNIGQPLVCVADPGYRLTETWTAPGQNKEVFTALQTLPGVTSEENLLRGNFFLAGLPSRYNVFTVNGAVQISASETDRQYLSLFSPSFMIREASAKYNLFPGDPGDASGGAVAMQVKDQPDQSFLRIQLGSGFELNHNNEIFYGDKRLFREAAALPVRTKELPSHFPNTTTRDRLIDKNPQEKTDLLRSLPNNLAPHERNKVGPDENLEIGWGRTILFKGHQRWNIIGSLSHMLNQNIENGSAAVMSDANRNPFPFKPGVRVLQGFYDNRSYLSLSQLSATISSSFLSGTNKFWLLASFTGQNIASHIQRSSVLKPDEDSVAGSAVRFFSEQRQNWYLQLGGEHALGPKHRLTYRWVAAYTYYRQTNPDDRNFLLRGDSTKAGFYELAQQQTLPLPDRNNVSRSVLDANLDTIFTNSGRSWRNLTDHFFTGDASLSFPFQLLKKPSVVAGGISIRSQFRVLTSDLLLYKGTGYYELASLLAPERYFPGGVDAEEYYTKIIKGTGSFNLNDVNGDNLGNYTGSSNLGAAFLSHSFQVGRRLGVSWGLRVESGSQLVSLFEFNYFEGFKKPDKVTLDENTRVTEFDVLPSASLRYSISSRLDLQANYFRSVNRPFLQELSVYRNYDPEVSTVYTGNRLLSNTTLDNFRGGFVFNGKSSALISLSGQYRKLYQPIENLLTRFASSQALLLSTPYNMPEATVYGIQLLAEANLSPLKGSWLSGIRGAFGLDWNRSKVRKGPLKSDQFPEVQEHHLAGSPEWAANGSLMTHFSKFPNVSVSVRYHSDYLVSVGSGKWVDLPGNGRITSVPSTWTKGRTQLDIQVSQTLFRAAGMLTIGITNLAGEDYILYQDMNGNEKFDGKLEVMGSGNQRGQYKSGTDNVVRAAEGQRTLYFRLSIQIR